MAKTKPFDISKKVVWEAYKRVRQNKGAPGIDGVTLEDFEKNLEGNLYKIWNRMSSGCYFPPAVKAVGIPKSDGGTRILGIPTVADRIAQTVAKMHLEPEVEPKFHSDSYAYRPEKSALDAISVTRQRCWRNDWVVEFDIKGMFDRVDHSLLLKAVRHHTESDWLILYIERWLKAPFVSADGEITQRSSGTPQGGVISPLLANLFLHYTFDVWMVRHHPDVPWVRYADDGLAHCKSLAEAENLLSEIDQRFKQCRLQLHPSKTAIVYCRDDGRRGDYPNTKFVFLGYEFRPRRSKNRHGKYFISFSPAVSRKAVARIGKTIRGWRLHLKPDKSIEDLSRMFNPVIRGWWTYYGRFYASGMYGPFRHVNRALIHWVRRKNKTMKGHRTRAEHWLGQLSRRERKLFVHWQIGILPAAK